MRRPEGEWWERVLIVHAWVLGALFLGAVDAAVVYLVLRLAGCTP